MSVKIQINSLEALERLIGNDTELEIELRQAVAVAMTKKYVSTLVDKETLKQVIIEITKEQKLVVKPDYCNVTLSDRTKEEIKKFVSLSVSQAIRDIVEEYITQDLIEPRVKSNVEYTIGQLSNTFIKEQIDEKVKEEIKSKFNII